MATFLNPAARTGRVQQSFYQDNRNKPAAKPLWKCCKYLMADRYRLVAVALGFTDICSYSYPGLYIQN